MATAITLLLAACSPSEPPEAWGPLQTASGERCPTVAGRFETDSPVLAWAFADRALRAAPARHATAMVELSQTAVNDLVVVAAPYGWERGAPRDTVVWHHDTQVVCEEGFLVLSVPLLPREVATSLTGDAAVAIEDDRHTRQWRLRLAVGAMAHLVVDLERDSYLGIAVWCGDGCRYAAIPFTGRRSHTWLRAGPLLADGRVDPRSMTVREQRVNERMAAEEEALESGRPLPESADVAPLRARAEAAQHAIEAGPPPR